MIVQEKYVRTCNAVILWDGITQPDTDDSGAIVHSLKVACIGTAPEANELQHIAGIALAESEFKGNLPPGALWPVNAITPDKYEGMLPGHVEFNAKSRRGAPTVYDVNGNILDPMQYGSMLYPGAVVQVLVHAYAYNKKSKGVAFGLDGIQIIDASAPRLPIGGGIDAGAVFGAPVPGQPVAPAPVPGQPVAPAPVPGQPVAPAPVPGQPAVPAPVPGQPAVPAPVPGQPVAPAPVPGQPVAPAPVPGQVPPPHPGILNPGQQ